MDYIRGLEAYQDSREAAITLKEMMAEAKNTLASDGLPQ